MEGPDATGVVGALKGEGGMPQTVWIGNGWLHPLRPDALGVAVGEAFMAAPDKWSSAWMAAVQEA